MLAVSIFLFFGIKEQLFPDSGVEEECYFERAHEGRNVCFSKVSSCCIVVNLRKL